MAHIEVPFGEHYITIVHIPVLSEMNAMILANNMARLLPQVDWPHNSAIIVGKDMFGRFKNVPVVVLESKFLTRCREVCEEILNAAGVVYSSDWEYSPHITNPPDHLEGVAGIILPEEIRIAFKTERGVKKKVGILLRDST